MQYFLFLRHFSVKLYSLKLYYPSKIVDALLTMFFGNSIPGSAKIGKSTKLSKGGIALVIHERAIIGENCIIGSCVLIGGKSKERDVPIIGDNVYVGSGAKILGPIIIGNNVIIGPNSVVLNDVPDGSIVVGIPGKVIKSNILMKDYV